ncbi:MAG: efflux RND transporter permease subunit [Pirellulales bacterium]|nr:efflux RND transporter permease subunit [Pirellulales bacterium]
MSNTDEKTPWMTRLVEVFLRGDVALLLVVVSVVLGAVSLYLTPREEEPQIVVPMADVFVSAPGLSARLVEEKITARVEKLLTQIDGVEYVYSMSRPEQCIVTVRFYVGEDREDSIVKLYNKIHSNADRVPPEVAGWVVKPIEVDDVPIVNVTLWSDRTELYGDYQLRRMAEQLQNELQAIPNTNQVWVIGGRPRRIRVELDPVRLAARRTSALQVADALRASNVQVRAGQFEQQDTEFVVDAGTFVGDARDLQNLVIGLSGNRPVYLKDVATVLDGPAETDSYGWIGFGPAAENPRTPRDTPALKGPSSPDGRVYPAVHIAVAKKKGENAVWVADAVEHRMHELAETHLPDGVYFRITRDYGETANEKVNELVESLFIAVLTVVGLIGLVIGWRAALVVALAIPVCYSLTLFINLLAGYSINRVTLFALILSLGLLVDDPITDVENIARYFAMRVLGPRQSVLKAIQEVRPALILSTLAIIVSFLPLTFITGMMGPYMAPMALNVPLTVTVSTLVAFVITPWSAMVALRKLIERPSGEKAFDLTTRPVYRISRAVLNPILDRRWLAWATLAGVAVLLAAAMALPAFRVVPLKMLPYDNKNEFQIVVDMPEGTTLQATDAVTRQLGAYLAGVAEVRDYQLYVGLASPMDFNGMVRHYFLRRSPNLADIRVNLAPKEQRAQQSHVMLLRIRDDLTRIAEQAGANIKLVEVPPGPPVIASITAEVYGPPEAGYDELIAAARRVEARMSREEHIVDVDISAEADQPRLIFETDKPKAALSGVSTENLAKTLQLALSGLPTTILQVPGEVDPLWVDLRVKRAVRSAADDLEELYVVGQQGQLVQVGALGQFVQAPEDKTIYHKNLRRVVYVYGEVAGRPPADAIIDMQFDRQPDGRRPKPAAHPRPLAERTWLSPGGGDPWAMPVGYTVNWAGEGEWKITLDVFRDLGLAFGAALVGIFVVLMFQTGSRMLPIVIMLAIPLTMIGIMPGFWLLNVLLDRPIGPSESGYPNPVFLTATAMIGMIALAGIVVRNSVVLIDFIYHGQANGLSMREAVIQSVAVRTRPILLTAGTTLLGNWVITLDPIFSGLAWAIIFGILTSTLFTLLVIPVVYWLLYGKPEKA